MPDIKSDIEGKKLFYRMGEVCKMLDVPASLLRFWEKDIDCLRNISKNRKGDRLYSEKNIEDIKLIYHLVKVKGYTLQGANEYIKANEFDLSQKNAAYASLLKVRTFLEELKENL